jgi:hypothetical protein
MQKLKRETKDVHKSWLFKYNLFKEFLIATENKYPKFQTSLGNWVANQRAAYRKGKLSLVKIQMLKELDFMFSIDEKWTEKLEELKTYIENTKKISPATGQIIMSFPSTNTTQLGCWCNHQRQQRKKNKLPDWKIEELNNIGFVWQYK